MAKKKKKKASRPKRTRAKKKKKKVKKNETGRAGQLRRSLNPAALFKSTKKKKKIKKRKKTTVKAKKFPGTTFKKRPANLVGDSYQANERDLKKLRRIAKRRGVSKAEILRYATTLVLKVYDAQKQGKKKLTIDLEDIA